MPKRLKLFIIPFIAFIFLVVPVTDTITIKSQKENQLLAYFPLRAANSRFQIVYNHSIHHSDVKEEYQVLENGVVRQVELEYEDTAVGMPSNSEEGETFQMKDGKYYIRNMKRDFPWIDLSTGQVSADHRLVVGEKVTPFTEITEPGSVVRIEKRKLSLWQQWKGVNIVGR